MEFIAFILHLQSITYLIGNEEVVETRNLGTKHHAEVSRGH